MSELQHQSENSARRGRLFYIMGASGAGKDTLLRGCRERTGEAPGLLVAHRYITRTPDGGTEHHVWLSDAEFEQRVTLGAFAMHWSANGFRYGIGREIDLWLAGGSPVLVNGSRGYLDAARARYGSTLIPVLITVDPDRLQRRLRLRGREDNEAIAARLRRARELQQQLPPDCLVIENNGEPDTAVGELLTAIAAPQDHRPTGERARPAQHQTESWQQ
ncbi:ribose 1,5-bisphosphokinase [Marinobacter sp. M-5]|uniref:ribose 1,5-bisphosphokinase n=1 Tax=Marinobacter sp. M-5 TaxID=3081089 RepID=UPI00293CEC51|nr:ribose 1,5-bisphosphokinase [Marinobacter sp. M-5]MDV3504264.1 ribose 1,5-bisphosphokinase [Marinobacter sp. M-5]